MLSTCVDQVGPGTVLDSEMTVSGVGSVVYTSFEAALDTPTRYARGRQVASYLRWSHARIARRTVAIAGGAKAGNQRMRWLLPNNILKEAMRTATISLRVGIAALLVTTLVALRPESGFAQDDPFIGTWVLNVAKSKGNPPLQRPRR